VNTKQMVKLLAEKYGAINVLLNAVSMVVDEMEDKDELTENERYLLEAWNEYTAVFPTGHERRRER